MIELARRISRKESSNVVQATHDMEVAQMGDAILTLRYGRLVGRR